VFNDDERTAGKRRKVENFPLDASTDSFERIIPPNFRRYGRFL